MRAVVGLLLLLLGLCGSATQVREFQKRAARDAAEESPQQTTCDVGAEVKELRDMVAELKVELRNMEAEVKDSKSQVDELKTERMVTKVHMQLLQKENSETPKVAFYAALSDAGILGPYKEDTPMRYSKVFTNVGNAYNPATGVFIAPVRGVYNFQLTVCADESGQMGVYVYKNNERIMHNWEYDPVRSLEYLTKSLVLELMAGDQIHLDLPRGYSVYDDGRAHTTFSGFLLFPL